MARYPGTSSGSPGYVFKQEASSANWTIVHGLGKYPSVTVLDSAKNQCEGEITYVSTNELTIKFSGAFTGTAFLS